MRDMSNFGNNLRDEILEYRLEHETGYVIKLRFVDEGDETTARFSLYSRSGEFLSETDAFPFDPAGQRVIDDIKLIKGSSEGHAAEYEIKVTFKGSRDPIYCPIDDVLIALRKELANKVTTRLTTSEEDENSKVTTKIYNTSGEELSEDSFTLDDLKFTAKKISMIADAESEEAEPIIVFDADVKEKKVTVYDLNVDNGINIKDAVVNALEVTGDVKLGTKHLEEGGVPEIVVKPIDGEVQINHVLKVGGKADFSNGLEVTGAVTANSGATIKGLARLDTLNVAGTAMTVDATSASITGNVALASGDREVSLTEDDFTLNSMGESEESIVVKKYVDDADKALDDALTAETNRAEVKETELDEKIDEGWELFDTEFVPRLEDRLSGIDSSIVAEKERASGAEEELKDYLKEEIDDRVDGDKDLQSQLDAQNIKNGSAKNSLVQRSVLEDEEENENVASQWWSAAFGRNNESTSYASFTVGTRNKNDGDSALVGGADNIVYTNGMFSGVVGQHNEVSGRGSLVAGEGNTNKVNQSLTAGVSLVTDVRTWNAVGRYNALDDGYVKVFVVGNGKDAENRSNAFEVFPDGHAEVAKTGDSYKSVPQKDYVDYRDNSIIGRLEKEEIRAKAAEENLSDDLNTETSNREKDVNKAREEFKDADDAIRNDLSSKIDSEIDRSTDAESELSRRLDVVEGEGEGSIKKAVADEATIARAAEEANADAVSKEKSRAEGVEVTLTIITQNNAKAISDEKTRATAEETSLQSQIDAITASSDVKDIVGTKAQLNAYPTKDLGDNDIIKVLKDESADDVISYYRWEVVSSEPKKNEWIFIGSEGPYYTKSELDISLNKKADLVNGVVPDYELPDYADILYYNKEQACIKTPDFEKIIDGMEVGDVWWCTSARDGDPTAVDADLRAGSLYGQTFFRKISEEPGYETIQPKTNALYVYVLNSSANRAKRWNGTGLVTAFGSLINIENGAGAKSLQQKSTETASTYTYDMDGVSQTITIGVVNENAKGAVSLNGKSEASGKRALAVGSGTAARGDQSIATGAETIASGKGAIVGGYMSEATHDGSIVIGQHLKSNVLGGVVLGFYNDPNSGVKVGQVNSGTSGGTGGSGEATNAEAKALFTIANGSSNTDRQNIFQVYSDGTAYIKTTEDSNEAAIVNKQHLNAVVVPLRSDMQVLNSSISEMRSDFQNQINNKLGLTGGLISGPLYLSSVSPENHVATKKYVDDKLINVATNSVKIGNTILTEEKLIKLLALLDTMEAE